YDMTMTIFPAIGLTTLGGIINLFGIAYGLVSDDSILTLLQSIWESASNAYMMFFVIGSITTITEWKKIYCSSFKKILYTFTFPLFMFTYIPIAFVALFKKVEWKQIEHRESITLREVRKNQI
ncbi:MAG: N-acetylglucosaminyltransferase, partial [Clostridiales bacterium]|nr:N-acetylglucosaminyltransferase [Clostridiales bacterium]